MSYKFREFRILKEIPGTANPVDDFVKEQEFMYKKDDKDETIIGALFFKIAESDVIKSFKTHAKGIISVEKVIIGASDLDQLVELGYIEEYEDKFLMS